jgi:hypothetical protein
MACHRGHFQGSAISSTGIVDSGTMLEKQADDVLMPLF